MAELVDALDLGSSGEIHGGSSPFTRTSDESVRTIRTLYININSIWVDFFVIWKIILQERMVLMINIIKQEITIEESLRQRLEFICEFSHTTPTFINGFIHKVDKTNLSYVEPHKIIIKGTTFLAFNYSNEIYIKNLSQKIKLSELEDYLKGI